MVSMFTDLKLEMELKTKDPVSRRKSLHPHLMLMAPQPGRQKNKKLSCKPVRTRTPLPTAKSLH